MQHLILEVKFTYNNAENTLYIVIIQDDQSMILIDCGYAGFMPLIEEQANKHGLSLNDLIGIIITHPDIDHIAGLYEIKEKYPSIKVYASELDKSAIEGREKSARLEQAERIYPTLPEDQRAWAQNFERLLKSIKPVNVDYAFTLDEEPAILPGIRIVNTPGHMPGHISVYLKESKTLVAADALVVVNGALELANPRFTLSMIDAINSVKKIREMDIERIICYHGGVIESGIREKLDRLIEKSMAIYSV